MGNKLGRDFVKLQILVVEIGIQVKPADITFLFMTFVFLSEIQHHQKSKI